jgi:hypothetical protein
VSAQFLISTTDESTSVSPTVHSAHGYVFYFVSFDVASGEPPHIHVGKGRPQPGGDAKFWLQPTRLANAGRFGRIDLRTMQENVDMYEAKFLEEWYEYRKRI